MSGWNAATLAGAAWIVLLAIAFVALPPINEVPAGFPAASLWNFRIASLGIQTLLWMGTGLMFGWVIAAEW